ncbi:MAG: M23 family metallopeptidase [Kangiellaceae bacterium]|jgi:murein DD-endopeptidase MepM/ murein hydrolase activator NlpD|nr:M23 family metallopeptidase [Kangiellaceae bacterium]
MSIKTFMKILRSFVFVSLFSHWVALAVDYEVIDAKLVQGGYLIGKTAVGSKVFFAEQQVSVDEQGYFIIGFGRDFEPQASMAIESRGTRQDFPVMVKPRQWQIERIDGLPPGKVNPTKPSVLKRIRSDSALIRQARAIISELSNYRLPFVMPAHGRISGVYGSQRVLNGDPKRPHFGQDIAAKVGTPVTAPAGGIITLAHEDMFYSGATVIIDHGMGLSSTYLHLNSIGVKQGQVVKQGDLIGTIGKSGRATGPHLDWRINWMNQRLDPALFIK